MPFEHSVTAAGPSRILTGIPCLPIHSEHGVDRSPTPCPPECKLDCKVDKGGEGELFRVVASTTPSSTCGRLPSRSLPRHGPSRDTTPVGKRVDAAAEAGIALACRGRSPRLRPDYAP